MKESSPVATSDNTNTEFLFMATVKKLFKNWCMFIIYLVVLVISFLSSYYLPVNEIFRDIIALPGVGALILALYKTWKDEQLQNRQQDFILGTASHMAQVTYNKHVEFCEEYVSRIQKGFQELLKDGPSINSINIGRELVNIRQKHSTWLTHEIENNLKPFELTLIKIGARERYLEISNLPIGNQRNKIVEEIFKSFGLILGDEKPLNEDEANLYIEKIIEKIRDILGINTLTKLRLKAINLALERLKG